MKPASWLNSGSWCARAIAAIHTRLADINAHSAEARAASILAGLGFDAEAQARLSDAGITLSGDPVVLWGDALPVETVVDVQS